MLYRCRSCFHLISLALMCCALLLCHSALAASFRVNSLIVFGGGSSDNGNTYRDYHFPVSPPYWHGRFSNGPVFSEDLAYDLQLIPNPKLHPNYPRSHLFYDYAYFNAVVLARYADLSMRPHYTPRNLASEVNAYLQTKHKPYLGAALVLIAIGTNDTGAPSCLRQPMLCLQKIVDEVNIQVERLVKSGLTHFIIVLPGDVQGKPGFKWWFKNENLRTTYKILTPNYIREFTNVKLAIERKFPKVHIALFDSLQAGQAVHDQFSAPLSVACYNNGNLVYTRQVGAVCQDPNQHLYFDNYFFSARAYELFADQILKQLKSLNWVYSTQRKHWWQRLL